MSPGIIHAHAHRKPNNTAIIHNGRAITYSAFSSSIDAAVDYLQQLGLADGKTVAILAGDLLESWVALFALHSLGLNTVSVGSLETLDDLQLKDVTALLTTEAGVAKYHLNLQNAAPGKVIIMPRPQFDTGGEEAIFNRGKPEGTGDHILYTSGTTGRYKKLLVTGKLQSQRAQERLKYVPFDESTRYHCGGFGLWTSAGYKEPITTWHGGGCVILDERPDWYRYFLAEDLTHAVMLASMLDELLNYLEDSMERLPPSNCHLWVGGAFLSRQSATRALDLVTPNIENTYGSTETNRAIMLARIDDLDDLHWLLPNPSREVQIVDESGHACPVGAEGQLRVAITELDLWPYLDDPAASEAVFRHGFFYPGDIAVRREDGRIRVLGRSTDVINLRGQKLASAPMEETIQNQLGLKSVCMFSGINESGEEELVVTFETDSWPEQSYLDWIGREFSQFTRIRFAKLSPFPRTKTGTNKVDRVALRKLVFPT